jgi:hypothetical protein
MGSARRRNEREYKRLKCDCANDLLDRRSKRSRPRLLLLLLPALPVLLDPIRSRAHTRQIAELLPQLGQLSREISWRKLLGLHRQWPEHLEAPLGVTAEPSR